VAACALRIEQDGRGNRPRLSSVCEKPLSGARYVTKGVHIEQL
jgi:hypothetical protein